MHSTKPKNFDPADVVRAILTAASALFAERRWPAVLLEMEQEGRLAALGFNDNVQNHVMRQVEAALTHLTPGEAKRFLGFDTKKRAYMCPHCYFAANRDWQEEWPHLAQFPTKVKGTTDLACIVCDTVTVVERTPCKEETCKGDVIAEEICLTCSTRQDEADPAPQYEFVLSQVAEGGATADPGLERCPHDDFAKSFGRDMLDLGNLGIWDRVSISEVLSPEEGSVSERRPIGSWTRSNLGLEWHQAETPEVAASAKLSLL